MIKAVIFDLDDTLISELDYIKSGYKVIAETLSKKYNIESNKVYEDLMRAYSEGSKYVFNAFFEYNKITYSKQYIDELILLYRNHTPKIDFFDDVIPTINKLKDMNIKLGIITDGYKETQKQKLEVLKAYDLFDFIIVTDELGREYWKPHPYAYELMKENLDVKFEEMIYVGDNPAKDFYISSVYPIKTIRIIRDNGVYKESSYLKNIRELLTISSLYEVIYRL